MREVVASLHRLAEHNVNSSTSEEIERIHEQTKKYCFVAKEKRKKKQKKKLWQKLASKHNTIRKT